MTDAADLRPDRRAILKAAAAVAGGVALSGAGIAPLAAQSFPAFRQALAEGVSEDEGLSAFYRETGYQGLWTGEGDAARRSALVTALSRAGEHGLPAARYDLDGLVASFHAVVSERDRGFAEALASRTFVKYARDVSSGVLEPGRIVPQIVRTLPRPDTLELMRGLAASEPIGFIRNLSPGTAEYARLLRAHAELKALIARGGWGPTVQAGALRPGESGAQVVSLRNRLIAMGYLPRIATARYDERMQRAVQEFQIAHGLPADGVAGGGTIREINVQAEARLPLLTLALERARWLNIERGQRHIWVNLADRSTQVMDDDLVTLDIVSIIGSRPDDMQTPEFSHRMSYLEVNPDWTLPRSIIARSYWGALSGGGAGHLEIVDNAGRVVPRSSIDFSRYTPRNFPYNVRQPPGPSNALGRVKFMFPNPWAIYLHDTPQRNLFNSDDRAYSSGCIRLQRPADLAYVLLARQSDDPQRLYDSTVASGRQTRINIETPVPVHLVYETAFTKADGRIHYRPDVYGRDRPLLAALAAAGVETGV